MGNNATTQCLDSRASSILINLNLNLNTQAVAARYTISKSKIEESQKTSKIKSYNNLRSTIKECYLTGSLKYGNNFIM